LKEAFPEALFMDGIKNNTVASQNIYLHELYIDNLASLTEYLGSENYKETYVFTKNKSTIDNFLNYNNIKRVKVFDCRVKHISSFYSDKPNGNNILVIADDNLDRVFVKKRVKRSFSKDLDLLVHIKE
jgi:hypothetical protein